MDAFATGNVQLVRGRKILEVQGSTVRREAAGFARVVIDLGAGDGRFAYRLARAHPDWLCVAIDANADGLREWSHRAARKPDRGGAPNFRGVRAAAERLPGALAGLADEVYVLYPWGSLLHAVLTPNVDVLAGIAQLAKPGARVEVRVNTSVLGNGGHNTLPLPELSAHHVGARLVSPYREAGIALTSWHRGPDNLRTTWGSRLGQGASADVIAITGVVEERWAPTRNRTLSEQSHAERFLSVGGRSSTRSGTS